MMRTPTLIIPDVHGDFARLSALMATHDFRPHGDGFRHPEGRTALFLGDLIDNGSENRRVIYAVRAMVDAGDALCLMGNHELNAVMFHNGHRTHSPKNIRQHAAFLNEFRIGDADTQDVVDWFTTLPLRVDFGTFRAAHAFWGADDVFSPITRNENGVRVARLPKGILPDLQEETAGLASEILDALKGPELVLPAGDYGFSDHYGEWRTAGRLRWWGGPDYESWQDAMISLGPVHRLPETRPGAEIAARAYPQHAPNLFIGHYKMKGDVVPISKNVICLDFPATNPFATVDPGTGEHVIGEVREDLNLGP